MSDESVSGEAASAGTDAEVAFESQARAAGLVLPKKAPKDPWGALAIVVAVIVLAAGIGEVTGWVNLRSPAKSSGNFETQTCTGYSVLVSGAISSAVDPAFATWLSDSGQNLSQAVGGCFDVTVSPNAGDGYLPLLGGSGSEFVATYTPPTTAEVSELPDTVAVLPVALGAVAVVYNLPGVPSGLNLTGSILAGIYNGTITSWDDPAIASVNPGVDLSGLPAISPFHVAGDSASNGVMSGFLASSSPQWASSVGSGVNVDWPSGSGVSSDAAMLAQVAATTGAIGYVDVFGTLPPDVATAAIGDAAGGFASANAVDTWVAANALANSSSVKTGNWTNFTLYGASAPGSYPLTELTYASVYRDLGVAYSGALSLANATWLLTYLYWLTGETAVSPLPAVFAQADVSVLNNETYDGSTIVHLEDENGETGETNETGEF